MSIKNLEILGIKQPLVSVIIPCYNAEKYVEQAVRSIMDQTYKNLEIIVVNDFSKDNTATILKKLAEQDNRIIYLENEKNLKLAKTLNKGLDFCKGDFIVRMDADDISIVDRIQKQTEFLLNNPDIDLVGGNTLVINENGDLLNFKTNYPLLNQDIIRKIPFKVTFSHPTVMARRSFFQDLRGYREMEYAEDYDCWIRGMLLGKRFANLQDILLYYRVHHSQMSANTGYSPKNEKIIRNFLFNHFLQTKNPNFLIGMIIHTKAVNSMIRKTYSFRNNLFKRNL